MTNTPIHRIPRDATLSLQAIVDEEVARFAIPMTLRETLMELIDPEDEEQHYTVMMDWAAQLRNELGCDWITSIRAAATMYFG